VQDNQQLLKCRGNLMSIIKAYNTLEHLLSYLVPEYTKMLGTTIKITDMSHEDQFQHVTGLCNGHHFHREVRTEFQETTI
jgi:hypothetical protein